MSEGTVVETGPSPSTAKGVSAAEQDFRAAMYEVHSNVEVRRLMFVLGNVLVPAMVMCMADCLVGASYPDHLRWLPLNILPLLGAALCGAGLFITAILVRCHFGMVVNGTKLHKVRTGELRLAGLNWLGVTNNFVVLAALSTAGGMMLFCAGVGLPLVAFMAGPTLFVMILVYMRLNHGRANRLSAKLEGNWTQGQLSPALQEEHARTSLEDTTADISVIVVMAAALFAGTFNAMSNLGGIHAFTELEPSVASLKKYGAPVISGFITLSLLLSARMVVRLRIALAQHSAILAKLRDEPDDPWRFRPQERSYVLFMLTHLFTVASTIVLVWSIAGRTWGLCAGLLMLVAGVLWYPLTLRASRRD